MSVPSRFASAISDSDEPAYRRVEIGMSEGGGFVNTTLLEEEHDQSFADAAPVTSLDTEARLASPSRAQARAVKAGVGRP